MSQNVTEKQKTLLDYFGKFGEKRNSLPCKVECPVCQKLLPLRDINWHLDNQCFGSDSELSLTDKCFSENIYSAKCEERGLEDTDEGIFISPSIVEVLIEQNIESSTDEFGSAYGTDKSDAFSIEKLNINELNHSVDTDSSLEPKVEFENKADMSSESSLLSKVKPCSVILDKDALLHIGNSDTCSNLESETTISQTVEGNISKQFMTIRSSPRKLNKALKCTAMFQNSYVSNIILKRKSSGSPKKALHSISSKKADSVSPKKSLHSISPKKADSVFPKRVLFLESLKKTSFLEMENLTEVNEDNEISEKPLFDDKNKIKSDKSKYRNENGYYLENFFTIINSVMSESDDLFLFNADELKVITNFSLLSLPSKKLYVKLFQRKLKWLRVSKIDYQDICDIEENSICVSELVSHNFLKSGDEMTDLLVTLQLLHSNEIKALCKEFKVISSGKKEDLIISLLKSEKECCNFMKTFTKSKSVNSPLMKRVKEILGQCCIVNNEVRKLFMRVFMLYALPRHEDDDEGGQQGQLTMLLMVAMGRLSFPSYVTNRTHRLFRSREDIIRCEDCLALENDMMELIDAKKITEAVKKCHEAEKLYGELVKNKDLMEHDLSLPTFLRRFTALSTVVYILTCAVDVYQRLREYKKAVSLLNLLLEQKIHLQDYRGYWYDRLALNLEKHLSQVPKALKIIKQALCDEEVRVGHKLSLSMRAERILNSNKYSKLADSFDNKLFITFTEAPKVIIEGRSLPSSVPGDKRVFMRKEFNKNGYEEEYVCSVEELVLGHYKDLGYTEGLHKEGITVNSIFGLLFWREIYSSVPDAFRSPHQAVPLDLDSPSFYKSRKDMIDKRLKEIPLMSEEELYEEIAKIWNENINTSSIGLILSMGLTVICHICKRLAKDHRFTRSGFPDLIVWNPKEKISCIVEVKGPNDRLSTKQMLWLDFLLNIGASAEVCHVEAIGAKRVPKNKFQKTSPRKFELPVEDTIPNKRKSSRFTESSNKKKKNH